jgi:hypothetical protein
MYGCTGCTVPLAVGAGSEISKLYSLFFASDRVETMKIRPKAIDYRRYVIDTELDLSYRNNLIVDGCVISDDEQEDLNLVQLHRHHYHTNKETELRLNGAASDPPNVYTAHKKRKISQSKTFRDEINMVSVDSKLPLIYIVCLHITLYP